MHKDCILYISTADVSFIELKLNMFLENLDHQHFCKLVYCIPDDAKNLQAYILENRKKHRFSIDFYSYKASEQNGTCFYNALKYCDTNDVLLADLDHYLATNIEQLLAMQLTNQADSTISIEPNQLGNLNFLIQENSELDSIKYGENYFWKGLAFIFRPSFLSLKFYSNFNFITDYILQFKQHNHTIFTLK